MRSNPRLLFSEEEQESPDQPAPTPKPKQPLSSIKSNPNPKKENPTTQQRTVQADNGKKTVRLHFHPNWRVSDKFLQLIYIVASPCSHRFL